MKKSFDVHIHSNSNCNLRCRHCYNESGGMKARLEPEQLGNLLTIFSERFDSDIHLEGGEIFLERDILEKIASLPSFVLKRTVITTNGTVWYTDGKFLQMLIGLEALRISVEGHTDELHERIRNSDLAEVLEHALFYMSHGVNVWLRLTLNRYNCMEMFDRVIPGLAEKGFRQFQIYEFQGVGRGGSCADEFMIENLEDVLNKIAGCNFDAGIVWKMMLSKAREKQLIKVRPRLEAAGLKVSRLRAAQSISIHSDGSVFVCPWDNDVNHALFNVNDVSSGELLGTLEQKDFNHECLHCSSYKIVWNGGRPDA